MPLSKPKRDRSECETEILESFMQEFRNRMEYKKLDIKKLWILLSENDIAINRRTLESYLQDDKDREINLSFTNACLISKVLDFSIDLLRDKCISNVRAESIQQEEYKQHFIKKTADYELLKTELWERYKGIYYWQAAYFDDDTFINDEEREHEYIAECREYFEAKLKECNNDLFLLKNYISKLESYQEEIEGH